jgi:hypothetical protein
MKRTFFQEMRNQPAGIKQKRQKYDTTGYSRGVVARIRMPVTAAVRDILKTKILDFERFIFNPD